MSITHGRPSHYSRGVCRCPICHKAFKEWQAERLASGEIDHGTITAYVYGCHCDQCKDAAAEYRARYRPEPEPQPKRDTSVAVAHSSTAPRERPDISAWAEHGACRGEDPDLWHPSGGQGSGTDWSTARAICAGCPVRAQCAAYAIEWETSTVSVLSMWGGLTRAERLRQRRSMA